MNHLTDIEKEALVENMRSHGDRVFPGWGGVRRFAEAAGVSPQSMSRWLSGKSTPSPTRLPAIAKALGMDINELCGKRKPVSPDAFQEIVQGQIAAIDTQILLLRHNRRALTGDTDAKRHGEGVRIIGELLKSELGDR